MTEQKMIHHAYSTYSLRHQMLSSHRAFTMVEVLIVIGIILLINAGMSLGMDVR